MSVSHHTLTPAIHSPGHPAPATAGWDWPVRWLGNIDGQLGRELVRQSWHMLPGLIPFLFWLRPHSDPLSNTFHLASLAVAGLVSLVVFVRIQPVLRPCERRGADAVLGYALCVLGTLWLFPEHGELGMTVLAVLAFGDGMATLAGTALHSSPLPWNPHKSWAGTIAFVACAAPLATLVYWGDARPAVPLATAAACGLAASLAGAAAESLPGRRLNDNVRVGLAAAVAVAVTHHLLLAWN